MIEYKPIFRKNGGRKMLNINTKLCKGCSYCIKFCPKNILELGKERNDSGHFYPNVTEIEKCISCAMCATICPEGAIEIIKEDF